MPCSPCGVATSTTRPPTWWHATAAGLARRTLGLSNGAQPARAATRLAQPVAVEMSRQVMTRWNLDTGSKGTEINAKGKANCSFILYAK